MTGRSSLGLTLVVLMSGCGGSQQADAPAGDASTSTTGTTTSSTGAPPDRVPPEPFVLPAGCGDGVIVPGQYDCFVPYPLDEVEDELAELDGWFTLHPLDLEDDGRDEIVAVLPGEAVALLRWDGEGIQIEPPINGGDRFRFGQVQTRWDWNGDGMRDLTVAVEDFRGTVIAHPNLGEVGLGALVVEHQLPFKDWKNGIYGNTGFAVPVDVDGDALPEVLASMKVDGLETGNPAEDLMLFRRQRSSWEPVGEAIRWGPCGYINAIAYGDFDEDGDEDVALLDSGQACPPYPPTYDPEWYLVWVLLSNSETGTLELGGSYPTGGEVSDPWITTADVTGDGHVDLLVRISEPTPCDPPDPAICSAPKVSVMHGGGDGTFEEGNPVDLAPTLPFYHIEALSDADGDGIDEWMVRISSNRGPWVIPFDLTAEGIAPLVDLNDSEPGRYTVYQFAVGDINSDGVDDYAAASGNQELGVPERRFLMVSAP